MISEDEAFWTGIAVATMMLGGGFSMLFLRALTGEGAVVLALGLMTMALIIQLRAKPGPHIETWSQLESRALTPTPPVESSEESLIEPEQTQMDSYLEQEAAQPTEQPKHEEQPVAEPPQPQQAEQVEEPSVQPEAPKQGDAEPKPPEQPEEEPIIVF